MPIAPASTTTTAPALRTLNDNARERFGATARLATGLRINRAADDPAGLIIANRLASDRARAEARVDVFERSALNQRIEEGALAAEADALVDLRGARVAAASDFSGVDRDALVAMAPPSLAQSGQPITQAAVDDAFDANLTARAELGARQRSDAAMARVSETQAIYAAAAYSAVADADYAKETADLAAARVREAASMKAIKIGLDLQASTIDLLG